MLYSANTLHKLFWHPILKFLFNPVFLLPTYIVCTVPVYLFQTFFMYNVHWKISDVLISFTCSMIYYFVILVDCCCTSLRIFNEMGMKIIWQIKYSIDYCLSISCYIFVFINILDCMPMFWVQLNLYIHFFLVYPSICLEFRDGDVDTHRKKYS